MAEDEVVKRLTARWTCGGCGAVYNLITKPPKEDGKCDACQAALVQRSDDTEVTVRKRLMVFNDLTAPLLSYYKHAHEYFEVDGAAPMDDVTKALETVLLSVKKA